MRTLGLIAVAVGITVALVVVGSRTEGHKQDPAAPAQVATNPLQVVRLSVPDMFCPGCEVGVKVAAARVEGVTNVKTDSDQRTADVTFDPSKTTAQAIASAITKGTGFKTEVSKSDKNKT